MARARDYERAIRALNNAYNALGAISPPDAPMDDSRMRLRSDIAEYADYLERASWWRSESQKESQ